MTQQPDDLVEQKPAWWMPRYIKTQAATITALRQRVAELEGERDSYKAALEEQRSYTQEEVEILQRAFASGRLIFEMIDGKTKTERVAIARTALERRGSE